MLSATWINKRRSCWNRLKELLDTAEKGGLNSLNHANLRELSLLYRQTAADLSTLRQDPSGKSYEPLVHQLLRRAHNAIYAGERPPKNAILQFVTRGFPEVFVRTLPHIGIVFCIFLAGAVVGAVLTLYNPDYAINFLGPQMIHTIERQEMWTHSVVSMKPTASSFIMTNNISVSIATFAGGIVGGIGTVYLEFFNGLMLGVVGTACWMHGMSEKLWSFVAPHGVLELPAIFIAGGAGLRLAQGLLFPGYMSRRASLVAAGSEAIRLFLGIIPILVIAGLIEGFVSPTDLSANLKFMMGGGLFALFAAYMFSPLLFPAKSAPSAKPQKTAVAGAHA
jgi:uncharacterized membrane protein SpoIIM required for sporulation